MQALQSARRKAAQAYLGVLKLDLSSEPVITIIVGRPRSMQERFTNTWIELALESSGETVLTKVSMSGRTESAGPGCDYAAFRDALQPTSCEPMEQRGEPLDYIVAVDSSQYGVLPDGTLLKETSLPVPTNSNRVDQYRIRTNSDVLELVQEVIEKAGVPALEQPTSSAPR